MRFIRTKDVLKLVGVSRSTLWRLVCAGRFPQRISISARTAGHDYDAVQAWMAERAGYAGPPDGSSGADAAPEDPRTEKPPRMPAPPNGRRRRRGRS